MTVDTNEQMHARSSSGGGLKSEGESPGSTNSVDVYDGEVMRQQARKRRAKAHGFTDYEPPKEWGGGELMV